MSIKLVALLLCGLATPVIAQTSDEAVAPSRITVKMTPGITSSAQLPTPELIAARKAETAHRDGDEIAHRWWLGICSTLDRALAMRVERRLADPVQFLVY